MRIILVGPCAAGKTTLANSLCALGYDAHDIAQEHSNVQRMWRVIARPDLVIYLDVSLETIHVRLQVNWEQSYLDEMHRRLTDAQAHSDFYLRTDLLSREEVLARVLEFLCSLPTSPPS